MKSSGHFLSSLVPFARNRNELYMQVKQYIYTIYHFNESVQYLRWSVIVK